MTEGIAGTEDRDDETTLQLLTRLVECVPRDVPVPMVVPLATRIAKLEADLEEARRIGRRMWENLPPAAKPAIGDVSEWPWLESPDDPRTPAELVE